MFADFMRERAPEHREEVEWQFEAPDLGRVESWLEGHPSSSGLAIVPGATRELTDTYYDTEDWRLYRAGYALRVRRDGEGAEATMKSLAPAEDALRRRHEISEPLDRGIEAPRDAGGLVGERLRGLAGAGDLRPIFEIRTHRRTFALRPERPSAEGIAEDAGPRRRDAAIGEVALDESEISGETSARLSRVEVEVDAGFVRDVEEFVGWMRDALGLRPAETSKFEAGLSAAGLDPAGASETGYGESAGRSHERDGR